MNNPFSYSSSQCREEARKMRIDLIRMLVKAKSGHTAGPLDMADVFSWLYFDYLRFDPHDPWNDDRDRLVLSCGHICPILYVALAHAGFFPVSELATLRQLHSRLQGHPHAKMLPGIETSSGPLGQGISQAIGMAIAAKMDKKDYRVVCVMSDGEHQEGQAWEGALFAAARHLDNLIVVIDDNNIEIDGYVSDLLPVEPFSDKYEAFGWEVHECDGNNIDELMNTAKSFSMENGKPKVIIAHTVAGKGVPFMENEFSWHGKPPSAEDGERAISYLTNAAHE